MWSYDNSTTGITDPEKLCADLKLRSKMTAESALSFWAGAGLLERYEENAAPGEEPTAPAPMTWSEIAAASRTDPMISSLIDCAQTSFARPLTHPEMEKLVIEKDEGIQGKTLRTGPQAPKNSRDAENGADGAADRRGLRRRVVFV